MNRLVACRCLCVALALPMLGSQRTFAGDSTEFGSDDPTVLDPAWLAAARHPETGLLSRHIRLEESAAYFAILNHVKQLSLDQLKSAASQFQRERIAAIKDDPNFRFYFRKPSADFPTFVDLYRDPDSYHGRLVKFRGHLRRLISTPAGDNAHGIQQLHEAWLYVDDAQQNPVVVVSTELPSRIPTGADILVDFVSATGYFFKRYGYEDRAGNWRFAPLILAQRLEWTPPPARTRWISSAATFWLVVAAGSVLAIVGWRMTQRRMTQRSRVVTLHGMKLTENAFDQESLSRNSAETADTSGESAAPGFD